MPDWAPKLLLNHSPCDHKGFDNVYPTVVKSGQAGPLTSWSGAGR